MKIIFKNKKGEEIGLTTIVVIILTIAAGAIFLFLLLKFIVNP